MMSTNNRQLWNDAKAGCPDALLILEADGAWHVYGEDAVAVKYAMGNVPNPTGDQLNAALEELTSRGTKVVFAKKENDHGNRSEETSTKRAQAETEPAAASAEDVPKVWSDAQKYAADPWTSYTGPQGGKGWLNQITGNIFYGSIKPGSGEKGTPPDAPPVATPTSGDILGQTSAFVFDIPGPSTMQDPLPLPPGTAKGLGATGAPGLANFTEQPGPGEPGGAAEWGTTESLASLYGRDNMSPQTAQRFNLSAAKAMGLEIPEGQKEQQAQLAEEFLRHNAQQLAQTMNAAESMGWKPRGKRLITNAGSAGRWLVGQAEKAGYERQGGGMTAELAGAVNHLQDTGGGEASPGLQAATEAFESLSKLVGPLIALPLAIAYGYINKGGTSAVAGANKHLDQLSERLGIRSPFVPTTTVDPKPEKPIKLRPEDFLDEPKPKREPKEPAAPKEPRARRVTDKSADAAAQAYIDKAIAGGWTPRNVEEEPQPAGPGAGEAQATKRRSETENRKALAREENENYHAAVNQIPFDYRQDFQQHVAALHADKAANVAQIVSERQELLGHIAGGRAGQMTREIQRSGDPDQVKGFDLLVQVVENSPETYGNLMGTTFRGDTSSDIETRLYEILKRPNSYYEPPKPSEVADELASEWLRQETAAEERTASTMDAEAEVADFDPSSPTFGEGPVVEEDEFDPQAVPFAKKYGFPKEFTERKVHPFMAKILDRMADVKKYGFTESEHPREGSGKPEGGRFAGGEKGKGKRPQTESPDFKAWFGESKIVDNEGKPLTVYHGTDRPIEQFDPSRAGFDAGIFFTADEEYGKDYASGFGSRKPEDSYLVEAHVNIANPAFFLVKPQPFNEETIAKLQQQGHDGVIVGMTKEEYETGERTIQEHGEEVVAFSPTQIKSSTGNQGNWNREDPRITHAKERPMAQFGPSGDPPVLVTYKNLPIGFTQQPDPYALKFARDLSTGKLPNLSRLEDPEVTIAEADRVLAVRPEAGGLH